MRVRCISLFSPFAGARGLRASACASHSRTLLAAKRKSEHGQCSNIVAECLWRGRCCSCSSGVVVVVVAVPRNHLLEPAQVFRDPRSHPFAWGVCGRPGCESDASRFSAPSPALEGFELPHAPRTAERYWPQKEKGSMGSFQTSLRSFCGVAVVVAVAVELW